MGGSENVLSHLGRLDGVLLSTGDEYLEVLLGSPESYESRCFGASNFASCY